jgi:hypothetical protein
MRKATLMRHPQVAKRNACCHPDSLETAQGIKGLPAKLLTLIADALCSSSSLQLSHQTYTALLEMTPKALLLERPKKTQSPSATPARLLQSPAIPTTNQQPASRHRPSKNRQGTPSYTLCTPAGRPAGPHAPASPSRHSILSFISSTPSLLHVRSSGLGILHVGVAHGVGNALPALHWVLLMQWLHHHLGPSTLHLQGLVGGPAHGGWVQERLRAEIMLAWWPGHGWQIRELLGV